MGLVMILKWIVWQIIKVLSLTLCVCVFASICLLILILRLLLEFRTSNPKYNVMELTFRCWTCFLLFEIAVESNGNLFVNYSRKSCSMERTSPEKCFNISQRSRWLSTARSGCTASSSETATTSMADACLLKMRVNSSTSGSCNEISRSSNIGTPVNSNGSQRSFGFGKSFNISDDAKFELLEDSQDPFAFDEDDFKPSKWDMLSGKQKVPQTKKCRVTYRGLEDGCLSQLMTSQQESSNRESNELHEISCPAEISCSDAINNENSNLLADCLLNAVKVFPWYKSIWSHHIFNEPFKLPWSISRCYLLKVGLTSVYLV